MRYHGNKIYPDELRIKWTNVHGGQAAEHNAFTNAVGWWWHNKYKCGHYWLLPDRHCPTLMANL